MKGRIAEWMPLEAKATGIPPLGILLADEQRLYVRMRPDWRQSIPQEDSDIVRDYETYIPEIAEHVGTAAVLNWLESSSTLPIRIGARQRLELIDVNLALEALFNERVLSPPPKLIHPRVKLESAPSRSTTVAAIGRFTFWRSFNLVWAIAIPVVMLALLLLQRHFLLQRYSQINKPSVSHKVDLPNPDISELPLTSFINVERPHLNAPLQLGQPAIRARRKKAPSQSASTRRQLEGELTLDVPSPISEPIILSEAQALGATVDARPQPPLPIPLPEAAPYQPKQNRFLHFFSVLFGNAPPKHEADKEHNQQERGDGHEIETTHGSGRRAIQGLR